MNKKLLSDIFRRTVSKFIRPHSKGSGLTFCFEVARKVLYQSAKQFGYTKRQIEAATPDLINFHFIRITRGFGGKGKSGIGSKYRLRFPILNIFKKGKEIRKQKLPRIIKHGVIYETVQLTREQRKSIFEGHSYIDIKNCFPTLLLNEAKKRNIPEDQMDKLLMYHYDRDMILQDYVDRFNIDKKKIKEYFLSPLFGQRKDFPDFLKNDPFHKAFRIQVRKLAKFLTQGSDNWKRSLHILFAKYIQIYQSEAIKWFGDRIKYYVFDGMVIDGMRTGEYQSFNRVLIDKGVNVELTCIQY